MKQTPRRASGTNLNREEFERTELRIAVNAVRPTLDLILASPQAVASLPREVIAELLAESTTVSALLAARLASSAREPASSPKEGDDWISIDEAAQRLGKTRRWIFKNARTLPFTRRVSKKTLLCSSKGIEKWLSSGARI
jgi:hypothetical protein